MEDGGVTKIFQKILICSLQNCGYLRFGTYGTGGSSYNFLNSFLFRKLYTLNFSLIRLFGNNVCGATIKIYNYLEKTGVIPTSIKQRSFKYYVSIILHFFNSLVPVVKHHSTGSKPPHARILRHLSMHINSLF